MQSTSIDKCTQEAVADILSVFLIPDEQWDETIVNIWSKVSKKYPSLDLMNGHGLYSVLGRNSDVNMKDEYQYLLLELTEDRKILPFVTLHSSDNWVHFRIYTLLTMFDESSQIETLAIRFETDEGDSQRDIDGLHDFCHAQFCKEISCRIRASTPEWLPDSQPAIPLDADDQIGLVLCMLTSLYGGAYVRRKINDSGIKNVSQHLEKVRALRGRRRTPDN